jgi:hypothetical protein
VRGRGASAQPGAFGSSSAPRTDVSSRDSPSISVVWPAAPIELTMLSNASVLCPAAEQLSAVAKSSPISSCAVRDPGLAPALPQLVAIDDCARSARHVVEDDPQQNWSVHRSSPRLLGASSARSEHGRRMASPSN